MPPITEVNHITEIPSINKNVETSSEKIEIGKPFKDGSLTDDRLSRAWSMSNSENELYISTDPAKNAHPRKTFTNWIIPDSDLENKSCLEKSVKELKTELTLNLYANSFNKFNLPSDSEDEENVYDLAKSPTSSIKSAEPPLPPPVSSIPSRHKVTQQLGKHPVSAPELHQHAAHSDHSQKPPVVSTSDINPYDEIENESTMSAEMQEHGESSKASPLKSKTQTHSEQTPTENNYNTYAKIPKKTQHNNVDEDEHIQGSQRKFYRQESSISDSTSEEGEKPKIPPKLWEAAGKEEEEERPENSLEDESEDIAELKKKSDEMKRKVPTRQTKKDQDGVTIEYNSLQRNKILRKGSLLGHDDDDADAEPTPDSPTCTHSSGFGENNNDMMDESSILSENSSNIKHVTEYEQSSTCVDMDQLSLDSSGQRPKRIVETHETHEIITSENNDDDIVERIIETQTITEKLVDRSQFKDHNGEDFSKYLENDDEFVSHIFTLGRTLEKGNGKKRVKSRDFAFVENPFSPPDPVIETKPLEKKTVKQKITTLVKKKKFRDDEIYAEVRPTILHESVFDENKAPNIQLEIVRDTHPNTSHKNQEPRHYQTNQEQSIIDLPESVLYESLEELSSYDVNGKHKKKETKSHKKSLFSGIRKLLKKHKSYGTDKSNPVVVEDDYQEFVP